MNKRQITLSIAIIFFTGLVMYKIAAPEERLIPEEKTKIINIYDFLDGEEEKEEEKEIFKPNIENDNKYIYASIELHYEYKEGDKLGYTLFIKKDGEEILLTDDILFDVPGGSVPKFYETKESNIILLKASMGDMGGFRREYYYVDLYTENVLKIVETQSQFMIDDIELTLRIEDNCPARTGLRGYVGGIAYLNSILINKGVFKYTHNPKIELNCIDPGGLGGIYKPQPQIKLRGVDVDGMKVYFEILEEIFYYDITNTMINRSEYHDSVYIIDKSAYYKDKDGLEILIAESINNLENETSNISYRKISLSPSGNFILIEGVGYEWSIIKVYDIKNRKTIYHNTRIPAPIFYNNDSYFYSCGFNRRFGKGTVIVYDLLNNEEISLSSKLQNEIDELEEYIFADIKCNINYTENISDIKLCYSDTYDDPECKQNSEYQFDFDSQKFSKLE